jgi:fatty-acyl-CoA synthase
MVIFHDSFVGNIDPIRNRISPDPDKLIYLKGPNPFGMAVDRPSWAEDYHSAVAGLPITEPVLEEPVFLDDPLAIVYTSGVTGNPKGAVLSHGQTFFKNMQVGLYTEGSQNDVLVAQMPLFHSGGLFIVATPAIMGGITVVMRAGFDPNQFAEDIQRYKATIVFALTTMWRMILENGKIDQVNTKSVRCVVGGGERTPPILFEELAKRGLHMQQGFGQTENSAMTVVPQPDIQRKMGSVGKAGFCTHIWVGDDKGNELPRGQIGEILAKGPTVMSGYWNLPAETKKAITNGVLHTGDVGYMDDEGFLFIVDRQKDMYRSGGENVYPAEVEKVLAGHPKIANAAIIGVPDDRWGETGMAFILPKFGQQVTEDEVREFLKGRVAKFKHPSHFRFVTELPLTATMKVRKAALKEQVAGDVKK